MKGMLYAGQVMAGAAWDLMSDPALLAAAKAEFQAAMGGETYAAAADLISAASDRGSAR